MIQTNVLFIVCNTRINCRIQTVYTVIQFE